MVESPELVRIVVTNRIDSLRRIPAIVTRMVGDGAKASWPIRGDIGGQQQ